MATASAAFINFYLVSRERAERSSNITCYVSNPFSCLCSFQSWRWRLDGDDWHSLGTLTWITRCSGRSRYPVNVRWHHPHHQHHPHCGTTLVSPDSLHHLPRYGLWSLPGGWERHLVRSGGMGPALTGSCACHFSALSTCSTDSQVIFQDLSHRVGGNKGAVAFPPPLSCPRTALPPSPWQPVAPSPAFTASPLASPWIEIMCVPWQSPAVSLFWL